MKRKPPKNNHRLVRPSGTNIRRFFPNNEYETTQSESHNEFGYALELLRKPQTDKVVSQGIVFEFVDEKGTKHSYTPDFFVTLKTGEIEIHEVSLESRRTRMEIQRREAAARRICEENGWRLVIVTETDLPNKTEFANLDFLYGFKAEACKDPQIFDAVLQHIPQDSSPVFAKSLEIKISAMPHLVKANVRRTLYYMLWHGILATDMKKLITQEYEFCENVTIYGQGEAHDA